MKYSPLLFCVYPISSAISTLLSAGMFAIQTDDHRRGFRVTRGVSFYLVVFDVILTILLAVMSLYDLMFSRRPGGDPTTLPDISGSRAITYDNPGYRDNHHRKFHIIFIDETLLNVYSLYPQLDNGIAMTAASGNPYAGSIGSVATVATTVTSVSNGSTLTDGSVIMTSRGPLRSSLKKPRPKVPTTDEFGIQNPGFHASNRSPSMDRRGSVKKVRIQTHSTDV